MEKISGYIIENGKVTGETIQCAHCQYTAKRNPGSGTRRAYCRGCGNFTCGRGECARDQHQKLERMRLNQPCITFAEYNFRLEDTVSKQIGTLGDDFMISEFGIILRR